MRLTRERDARARYERAARLAIVVLLDRGAALEAESPGRQHADLVDRAAAELYRLRREVDSAEPSARGAEPGETWRMDRHGGSWLVYRDGRRASALRAETDGEAVRVLMQAVGIEPAYSAALEWTRERRLDLDSGFVTVGAGTLRAWWGRRA